MIEETAEEMIDRIHEEAVSEVVAGMITFKNTNLVAQELIKEDKKIANALLAELKYQLGK